MGDPGHSHHSCNKVLHACSIQGGDNYNTGASKTRCLLARLRGIRPSCQILYRDRGDALSKTNAAALERRYMRPTPFSTLIYELQAATNQGPSFKILEPIRIGYPNPGPYICVCSSEVFGEGFSAICPHLNSPMGIGTTPLLRHLEQVQRRYDIRGE